MKKNQMNSIMTFIFNEFINQIENSENTFEQVKKIQSSLISVCDYINYMRNTVQMKMTTTTISFAKSKKPIKNTSLTNLNLLKKKLMIIQIISCKAFRTNSSNTYAIQNFNFELIKIHILQLFLLTFPVFFFPITAFSLQLLSCIKAFLVHSTFSFTTALMNRLHFRYSFIRLQFLYRLIQFLQLLRAF